MTSAAAVVPSSIDEVTPQWLAEALRLDPTLPEGLTVGTVRAEQIAQDTGFSSLLYRVHVTGSAGVPSTLMVKHE